jgi:hypothetical protein
MWNKYENNLKYSLNESSVNLFWFYKINKDLFQNNKKIYFIMVLEMLYYWNNIYDYDIVFIDKYWFKVETTTIESYKKWDDEKQRKRIIEEYDAILLLETQINDIFQWSIELWHKEKFLLEWNLKWNNNENIKVYWIQLFWNNFKYTPTYWLVFLDKDLNIIDSNLLSPIYTNSIIWIDWVKSIKELSSLSDTSLVRQLIKSAMMTTLYYKSLKQPSLFWYNTLWFRDDTVLYLIKLFETYWFTFNFTNDQIYVYWKKRQK